MSFDHNLYREELEKHYENRLGWSEETARTAAGIASDVLRLTFGGSSHYIPARNLDKEGIRRDHKAGNSVATLARRYGVSGQHVRNIIR